MDAHADDDHRLEHVRLQHRRRALPDWPRTRRLASRAKRSLGATTFCNPESRSTHGSQPAAQPVCAQPDSRLADQSWLAPARFFMDWTAGAPDPLRDVVDTLACGFDGNGDAARAGVGQ